MNKYNYFLDIIKFLCVFPIIGNHLFTDFICKIMNKVTDGGYLEISSHLKNASFAVDIYFIISGYLLYKSFNKEPNLLITDFIKKRFIRLFPLYFLSITFVYIFNFEYFSVKISHFNNYVYQIFMLQTTGFNVPGFLLNPYAWYVCVLFYSSIFMFLLFKICNKYTLYLILFIFSFLFYGILSKNGLVGTHRIVYYNFVSGGVLRAIAGLSLGALIANYRPTYIKNKYYFYFTCFIEILFFIILFSHLYYHHKVNYILLLIYSIIVLLLSIKINHNLNLHTKSSFLTYLNRIKFKDKYGYGIYILQWPVFISLYNLNFFNSLFFKNNLFISLFFIVMINCLVGFLFTNFINKILKLLKCI